MRTHGMQGLVRGKSSSRPNRTRQQPGRRILVQRDFTATQPNELWIVDFTYVPTWAGTGFTAFVKDVYSQPWSAGAPITRCRPSCPWTRLKWLCGCVAGQATAVESCTTPTAGSQYTAIRYADRLAEAGALASIGTVGDSYDNAMAESVIGLYKAECVRREGPFPDYRRTQAATLTWVDWYNTGRLHSSIGYVPPNEYEATYYATRNHQDQPVPGEPALH